MKRGILFFLISMAALLAQGCMFDVQNADIMRPPKLTTEFEEVKTLLDEFYGSGLKLMNPSSGVLRAAIQFIDLNNDQQEEAVAFFKDQNEQNALKVAILQKNSSGDGWRILPTIVGIGYDVDQVGFPDLDGDGTKEIVVGWLGGSMLSKGLSVYKSNLPTTEADQGLQQFEEIFREVYTNFHIADLDMDGTDELVTFLLSRPDNMAEASLYILDQDGMKKQDEVSLANDANRYER
ncbi:MAG: hypothetical protein GT601_06430, partial [Acidaminobacter sp.]|uniref:FG-GAP repeat domain-containing protein n=3 Tax=Acidaminobacter sp. TaxID=1872102 RepID=UPI001383BE76